MTRERRDTRRHARAWRRTAALFVLMLAAGSGYDSSGVALQAWPEHGQQAAQPTGQKPAPPVLASETPATFQPTNHGFDYNRRVVMIPMRDGIKLHTVILVPKGAGRAPILLTRTPYDATSLTSHAHSAHLGPILSGYDNATDVIVEGGYIRVVQDVRGKYGSEGDYVMNRPLSGPQNPTAIDHATDTYDTIDWLVKNVAQTNGKVGILGISYDGFLPLMALVNPHPALKVSVPMNPMVDGWMGDDWFHNGAFRQQMMPYIYGQEATRASDVAWWTTHFDDYDAYLQAGSAGELGRRRGLDQLGFWRKITEHPGYDAFWRDQAVDKVLAAQPLKVPVMLVHGLWDQEDIYGAPAVYQAIEPKDTANDTVFLVMGPWYHGQEIRDGSSLGAIRFNSDTALYFRQEILRPFLDQYLKDGAPKANVAPVVAFETGTNTWRRLNAWPSGCTSGCAVQPTPFYLAAGLKVSTAAPRAGDTGFDEYVSDPSKPVPFRARPIQPVGGPIWAQWLVDDQREASGRTDVLAFVSDVLTEPLKISGQPIANLVASTSGTDSDWVVKVIDVYPDTYPDLNPQPGAGNEASYSKMGGYQQLVRGEAMRGKFRSSYEKPEPFVPGQVTTVEYTMPDVYHTFRRGHRIMIQVQSSWFPLVNMNPQTFLNINTANAGDYVKATQRVYRTKAAPSSIKVHVLAGF